jgi:hypothetical protein
MSLSKPAAPDELLRRARRRVNLRMAWWVHALVFVLVNLGLLAVNLLAGGPRWHQWPLLGWGFGLAVHGVVTLAILGSDGVRERLLHKEIERLQRPR